MFLVLKMTNTKQLKQRQLITHLIDAGAKRSKTEKLFFALAKFFSRHPNATSSATVFVRCLRRPCYPPYSPQRLRVELMGAVLYSRNKCGHTAQSTWRIRLHVGANAHRTYTVYHGIRNTIPCWSSLLDQFCLDSRIDPSLADPESLIVQSCFKRPN